MGLVDEAMNIMNEVGRNRAFSTQDITVLTDYLTKLRDLVPGSIEVVTPTGERVPLTVNELLALASAMQRIPSARLPQADHSVNWRAPYRQSPTPHT